MSAFALHKCSNMRFVSMLSCGLRVSGASLVMRLRVAWTVTAKTITNVAGTIRSGQNVGSTLGQIAGFSFFICRCSRPGRQRQRQRCAARRHESLYFAVRFQVSQRFMLSTVAVASASLECEVRMVRTEKEKMLAGQLYTARLTRPRPERGCSGSTQYIRATQWSEQVAWNSAAPFGLGGTFG